MSTTTSLKKKCVICTETGRWSVRPQAQSYVAARGSEGTTGNGLHYKRTAQTKCCLYLFPGCQKCLWNRPQIGPLAEVPDWWIFCSEKAKTETILDTQCFG